MYVCIYVYVYFSVSLNVLQFSNSDVFLVVDE